MTKNPSLILNDVTYVLPDGRTLFSGLREQFDSRPTALVGRNGVGKTILARILAGEISPTSGQCQRSGRVFYLAQQVVPAPGATVADLANVRARFDAMTRIESGSSAAEDFDIVADQWDIRQRLWLELERNQLSDLTAETPASALSGGEAMRVALIGAMLSQADFLILDEPNNHLDLPSLQAMEDMLQGYRGALVVVSHDDGFLDALRLTDRLVATERGWVVEPV